MNTAELQRLINNLLRTGIVTAVDAENALCTVESGDNTLFDRPWLTLRAGKSKTWNPPTVGEQVLIFSPGGDLSQALILTGLYYNLNAAPSQNLDETKTEYPDGSIISYNHATHTADVTLCQGATLNINAPTKITITSDKTDITTELEVFGNSTFNGTVHITDAITADSTLSVTGAATLLSTLNVTDNIITLADVVAGVVTLLTHGHPLDLVTTMTAKPSLGPT